MPIVVNAAHCSKCGSQSLCRCRMRANGSKAKNQELDEDFDWLGLAELLGVEADPADPARFVAELKAELGEVIALLTGEMQTPKEEEEEEELQPTAAQNRRVQNPWDHAPRPAPAGNYLGSVGGPGYGSVDPNDILLPPPSTVNCAREKRKGRGKVQPRKLLNGVDPDDTLIPPSSHRR